MLNREGLKYLDIEDRAIDHVCFKRFFQDGREQACLMIVMVKYVMTSEI